MSINQTQEQANIMRQQAETISLLTHLGFDKAKVVPAVTAGDLSDTDRLTLNGTARAIGSCQ